MSSIVAEKTIAREADLDPTERLLLIGAKDGDIEAFGLLFERYRDVIFSFANRIIGRRDDAEDVVQETFYSAWRGINGFRGDSQLITWLCKIAANQCLQEVRSAKRRPCPASEAEIDVERIGHEDKPLEDAEEQSLARHVIAEALGKLSMNHRMLVVLCDLEGFTSTESARILGCSPISVRVRLCTARRKLRRLLTGFLEEVE